MAKVSVNLVTWNSLKFFSNCLDSLLNQTYKNFSILIIDNASNDGTIKFLEKNYPQIGVLKNARNLGFCKAHNQGIKFAQEKGFDYVLVANADIIFSPDCLENLVQAMENDKRVASIGPKLLKVKTGSLEFKDDIKTGIIDSCGFKILKSRRTIEIGAGELDSNQYNDLREVFGSSGALVLYRCKALEDVKMENSNQIGEYFDENFFAYKEDIDLAWRLRLKGWINLREPKAVAYHYRAASTKEKMSFIENVKNRRHRNGTINYYSYKNQLLLLLKNEFAVNFIFDFFHISFYEWKKFIYIFFFESRTRGVFWQFIKKIPDTLRKRRIIMKNRKVGAKEIRKWFR